MASKFALVIANTEYQDKKFPRLTAPSKDAADFAQLLEDTNKCGFDSVKVILNQSSTSVTEAIDEFFDERKPEDLLLLYFSGHGVRDDGGSLYLALKNTMRTRLRSTAVRADYIKEAMDQSRSKRQVVILDCCNSGAFPAGTKSIANDSMGMVKAFQGYGRFIITASDATQFAWEGDKVIQETDNSLFTHFLIEGLEGAADSDGDGKVTVNELYDYAYEQVVNITPNQTPGKWSYKEQGDIVLRDNLRLHEVKPAKLPDDLLSMLSNVNSSIRRAGIQDAITLLDRNHPGLARAAQAKLLEIAEKDDSLNLRDMVRAELQKRNLFDLITQEKKPPEKIPAVKSTPVPSKKLVAVVTGILIFSLCVWGAVVAIKNIGAQPVSTSTSVPTQVVVPEDTQSPPTQTSEAVPTSEIPVTETAQPLIGNDGMSLIFISAGDFVMGSKSGDAQERPVHTIYLNAYLIDQTEVTNGMYAACVNSGFCDPPRLNTSLTRNTGDAYYGNPEFDNYPVVYVTWDNAKAYCRWADRRLPTEAEWEKAASWDDVQKKKYIYPWGNSLDCSLANYMGTSDDCKKDTTPVSNYLNGASPYGVLDMAGNVWEWVADRYDPEYYGQPVSSNPKGPASGDYIVVRGGSFLVGGLNGIRSTYRGTQTPDFASHNLGFRCAVNEP